ncbi:MAG: glycosyltransferase family 4 protein [Planctomycetota bacterium]|nr:glycosyltransferase family 4 protein [Planctomycetota bacterium]MDP6990914.1 glycosyltransferase family 4 protein [Planctomycetota bacterium]
MKLLFLTQVLDADDAVLGFVSRWVRGLARHCERVRVVALEVGATGDLPANVDWREIGRRGVVRRYLRYRGVLRQALEREGFDAVLAHMVPRYALVAEGPARRAGAGVFLWYTHAGIDRRLERAVERVDRVFTASAESMRVPSERCVVTGHGIDLEPFDLGDAAPDEPPRLLSIGRLTPRKDPLCVLEAVALLRGRGVEVGLDLVGPGMTRADSVTLAEVRARMERADLEGCVTIHGAVPYTEVAEVYRRAACVVNASLTGSLDKTLLEAMACGRPVVSCSDAAAGALAPLGDAAAGLLFAPGDAVELAERVERLLASDRAERAALAARLREIVREGHEVDVLMERLVEEMEAACTGAGA